MFSFQNIKEIGNTMVGSIVMMHFARFSGYLNYFNSDFNPWIIVGNRIQQSSQRHWSKSVLMAGSKLGFLELSRVNLGSNLTRIIKYVGFDVETWKMLFWDDFDQLWLMVNPWLTKGILVNLAWNGVLSATIPKQVTPRQSKCFRSPMEES